MLCEKCGKENSAESRFCTLCGAELCACEEPKTDNPALEEAADISAVIALEQAPETAAAPALGTEPEPRPEKIRSHMAAAVITTVIFGNWILGIPAIVFARECELAYIRGQWDIAERFSRRALTFLAIGSALSLAVFSFIAMLASAGFLYF